MMIRLLFLCIAFIFSVNQIAVAQRVSIVLEGSMFGLKNIETDKFVVKPKYSSAKKLASAYILTDKKGKKGAWDEAGKQIVKTKYDEIYPISDALNYKFLVNQSGKWGILGLKNKVVVPVKYQIKAEAIASLVRNAKDELIIDSLHPIAINQNGKFGLSDGAGSILLPFKYDYMCVYLPREAYNKSEYAAFDLRILTQQGNSWNVIDGKSRVVWSSAGGEVLRVDDSYIFLLTGDVIAAFEIGTGAPISYVANKQNSGYIFQKNGKYALMSGNLLLLTEFSYDSLSYIVNDGEKGVLLAAKEKDKFFILNEYAVKLDIEGYDEVAKICASDLKSPIMVRRGKLWAMMGINGQLITEFNFQDFLCNGKRKIVAVNRLGVKENIGYDGIILSK